MTHERKWNQEPSMTHERERWRNEYDQEKYNKALVDGSREEDMVNFFVCVENLADALDLKGAKKVAQNIRAGALFIFERSKRGNTGELVDALYAYLLYIDVLKPFCTDFKIKFNYGVLSRIITDWLSVKLNKDEDTEVQAGTKIKDIWRWFFH